MVSNSLRKDLDQLKREVEALKVSPTNSPTPELSAQEPAETLLAQCGELVQLVNDLLEDAEDTLMQHPVATVAGALALGMIIGRLTAR